MTEEHEFGDVEPMMGLRVYLTPEGLVAVEHAAREAMHAALSRVVAAAVQSVVAAWLTEEGLADAVPDDAVRADCGADCGVCRGAGETGCGRVGPHDRHVCAVCEEMTPPPLSPPLPDPDAANGACDQDSFGRPDERCHGRTACMARCPQDVGHAHRCRCGDFCQPCDPAGKHISDVPDDDAPNPIPQEGELPDWGGLAEAAKRRELEVKNQGGFEYPSG